MVTDQLDGDVQLLLPFAKFDCSNINMEHLQVLVKTHKEHKSPNKKQKLEFYLSSSPLLLRFLVLMSDLDEMCTKGFSKESKNNVFVSLQNLAN